MVCAAISIVATLAIDAPLAIWSQRVHLDNSIMARDKKPLECMIEGSRLSPQDLLT